jgi:O-antigen/teichoic acid export membrane protein
VFWNTALLPFVTAAGVLLSILVRRSFGLESGIYDVVIGVANSILFYSGLGLAGSLPKFLPELQMRAGRRAAARLISQLASIRIGLVLAILVPLNIWARPLAEWLQLGADGLTYLRWVSVLLLGRAALDFLYRALDSFLQQLSVNALSLTNGAIDVGLAAVVVLLGLGMTGLVAALGISAIATAVLAIFVVRRKVAAVPTSVSDSSEDTPPFERVWKMSAVTYIRDLSLYFATPAFASPALLAVTGRPEPVAIFATSYFVAASTVTLVVSGFRGIYRPAFARVLAAGEREQLARSFDLMNKVQVLAVVPAGFGLAVMVADYLPLLYGPEFAVAVPVARILVGLLFAETALAVALLVLWADERYGPVLAAQVLTVAAAPLFVWSAGRFGLLAAAWVLGTARVVSAIVGYAAARRAYAVRFPWEFAGKVTLVSALMAAVLLIGRWFWPTSWIEAATLTAAGIVIITVGLRVFRVLGPNELDVLKRSSIPGGELLVEWLTARETT